MSSTRHVLHGINKAATRYIIYRTVSKGHRYAVFGSSSKGKSVSLETQTFNRVVYDGAKQSLGQ